MQPDPQFQYPRSICIGRILRRLHDKYDTILHFYFSRNLRSYLKRRPKNHESVLYNDLQFLDCQDEFLKRGYRTHEISDRIKLLSAYFKRNRVLPYEVPFICNDSVRKLLEKRVKRRIKITKKVKELDQAQPYPGDSQFIKSVATEQLEASESAYNSEARVSYCTKICDIYACSFSSKQSLNCASGEESAVMTSLITLPLSRKEEKEERDCDQGDVQHLVYNFNDRDTERIIREYNELMGSRQQVPRLDLKLNLSKLSRSRQDLKVSKPSYEEFYEQVKKKREEKRASKIYYVREPQRKHQLTSRSPEHEYMFLTSREFDEPQQRHRPTATEEHQLHSDRIYHTTNRMHSPELARADGLTMYRNGALLKVTEPTATILTDRKSERDNHYRNILDRIRQTKKQEMLMRAGSPQNSQERNEKNRKLELLKERAVELLTRNKSPDGRREVSAKKQAVFTRK